jgi:hypothetical protein
MPILSITGCSVNVDPQDLEWCRSRPWHLGDTGYAKCYSGRAGGTPLRMHRLIMQRMLGRQLTSVELVDHINGDKLDNRRSNLRLATKSQNGMNRRKVYGTSKYLGVHYEKSNNYYMSYISLDGTRWYCGYLKTEDEAAWLRDQWAIALHGEFARLNFEYREVPTQHLSKENRYETTK